MRRLGVWNKRVPGVGASHLARNLIVCVAPETRLKYSDSGESVYHGATLSGLSRKRSVRLRELCPRRRGRDLSGSHVPERPRLSHLVRRRHQPRPQLAGGAGRSHRQVRSLPLLRLEGFHRIEPLPARAALCDGGGQGSGRDPRRRLIAPHRAQVRAGQPTGDHEARPSRIAISREACGSGP